MRHDHIVDTEIDYINGFVGVLALRSGGLYVIVDGPQRRSYKGYDWELVKFDWLRLGSAHGPRRPVQFPLTRGIA